MTSAPGVIGIAGAGTMGAGIAQLAAQSGARALVHDPADGAARRAVERIAGLAERGKVASAAVERLEAVDRLEALAGAELVIEAAPESLELKRRLFADLEEIVGPQTVLATNTSSLLVTEIASGLRRPERVVGMHFFNPAPLMRLVEVVAGARSSPAALSLARATAEAMGRRAIDATDGPGFLVNRCNRPFGLEALELVRHGLASPDQVDRVARMAGGFRMGPFELMDLVGLDTGMEVALSFWRQSFGEPRWRPSPLVARMVAAGRLGRKTGEGWYAYPEGPPPDPEPPEPGGGDGLVVIAGDAAIAPELAEAAAEAGWTPATPEEADGEVAQLILDCGDAEGPPLQGGPQVILCDTAPLAALDPGGASAGFFALPPLGRAVELMSTPTTAPATLDAARRFFRTLGCHVEPVADMAGGILGRIVAQLVNEACFALGEGVGAAADLDAGMVLGLNHPRGPLAWGDAAGAGEIATLLRALQEETGDDRYRPAPALMAAARTGAPLAA